jgi:hypothetical protein
MKQNCVSGAMNSPNMLKERVLLTLGEFHCGPKRATNPDQELPWPAVAKLAQGAPVARSQFEV